MASCVGPLFAETDLPTGLWLWAGLTLVLTAVLAFIAGMAFARVSARWALERARRQVARLVPLVLDSLYTAEDACRWLAESKVCRLTAPQLEQLTASRSRLLETWERIELRQQQQELQTALEAQRRTQAAAELQIAWTREPCDERTNLPDRTAFDANLQLLIAEGTRAEVDSGLLVIRIDRHEQLGKRFGPQGAWQVSERMARLLCRCMRDKDLVCRFAEDTFAILMPGVDQPTGDRLAAVIRNTVRDHHFRLEETGPEVFVTASFGYTSLHPQDTADLVIERAVHALSQSERRGRNQLHMHDGSRVVHAAAV